MSLIRTLKSSWNRCHELVLPLLHQGARRHHQDPLHVAADGQLANVEAGHDGLAGARVVGQHEPQRLDGHHAVVDGFDLVGKRIDVGGGDRRVRIEQVGRPDATGFGSQLEQAPVPVERPRIVCGREGEAFLIGSRDQRPVDPLTVVLVDDLHVVVPVPRGRHHRYGATGDQTVNQDTLADVLQFQHVNDRWEVIGWRHPA